MFRAGYLASAAAAGSVTPAVLLLPHSPRSLQGGSCRLFGVFTTGSSPWANTRHQACMPARYFHPPTPTQQLHSFDEERVAQWCKRLWDITEKSYNGELRETFNGDVSPSGSGVPSVAPPPSSPAASSGLGQGSDAEVDGTADRVLYRLRRAIQADKGLFPGAVTESAWAAFDALVPLEVQHDLTVKAITPAVAENFFRFVSTLDGLNFDMEAVSKASAHLTAKLQECEELLRRQGEALEANGPSATTTAAVAAYRELTEKVMMKKGEVMYCCFEARSAGSPLFYTWLRHTAAMPDGLRRLMRFRKLVHSFEGLCKRRIRDMTEQQRQGESLSKAASSALGTTPIEPAAAAAEREETAQKLSTWRRRAVEVGLMDSALSLLFHNLFAKDYLVMEELTWNSTPPLMLDHIMRAESVHPFVRGLEDMRARLQPAHHRHLFAFLHPAVVEEPLIAVQVALTNGILSSVDHILGRPTPLADMANTSKAAIYFRSTMQATTAATAAGVTAQNTLQVSDGNVNTAIFYSINSAQSALRGMDMGNRLIKRVVQEVEGNINARRRAHNLTPILTFSTLSPIPLYVKWLSEEVQTLTTSVPSSACAASTDGEGSGLFGPHISAAEEETRFLAPLREAVAGFVLRHPHLHCDEAQAVMSAALEKGTHAGPTSMANAAVLRYLVRLFKDPTPWEGTVKGSSASDPTAPAPTTTIAHATTSPWWMDHAFTTALEAPLLRSVAAYVCAVKRSRGGRIRDPVGNFHISNGAIAYRLNYLANTTVQGSRESACVMVNYKYDLPVVSKNVTDYEVNRAVALGEPMQALLKGEE